MKVSQIIHSNQWKLDGYKINRLIPIWLNHAVKVLQLLIYMILMWMEFKKILKRWKRSENNPNFSIVKKWLIIFCSIATLISVLFAMLISVYHFYNLKSDFLKTAFYVLQLAGYAYFSMIFFLLLFPQVLYGLPVPHSVSMAIEEQRSTQTSLFSDEYLKEVELKLNEYVQQSFFLEQECSLSHLTQNTRVPLHHLSYYFSQVLLVRFPDWRNKLRIQHAMNLMTQGKASEMTLEALASECGFKHRSTFIEAFKRETGKTPSEFLKGLGSNKS
jgi:AraC-like DNA-binding protein